jgi:actin-related protein 2
MSKAPVVCDNGTGYVKCGFGGDNFPRHHFPSIVGRPQLRAGTKTKGKNVTLKPIMVGDECLGVEEYLEIKRPLENGQIRDWSDIIHIWDYVFNTKLNIDPTEHKILLTEPPMNPKKNREKMLENMFENYKFPYCHVAIQAVLVLYAQGLNTGVVVDTGDGVTHVIPVYQGYSLPNVTRRLDVAGRDITRYLIKLLQLRGYSLTAGADFETARRLKEAYCYCALDTAAETRLAEETTTLVEKFKLPDGRTITIGRERFKAPECLFRPDLLGKEVPGIAEQVFSAIQAADIDLREEFYRHIVLSGGTSMLAGFPSRLEKDVTDIFVQRTLKGDRKLLKKSRVKIKIEDPPRRKNIVFMGGSVLANLMKDVSEEFWFKKTDWDEMGPSMLNRK